ncbi:MAG: hypothetical protein JSV64_02885 [Candidatus Bathyarchaeota archaeon]|nr:MAG: hypothetical protein JSV64_02885 [Candidatus Bathyarchaeota archaeon]
MSSVASRIGLEGCVVFFSTHASEGGGITVIAMVIDLVSIVIGTAFEFLLVTRFGLVSAADGIFCGQACQANRMVKNEATIQFPLPCPVIIAGK